MSENLPLCPTFATCTAIHSPNEHFGLFNFYKGIETIAAFYRHYAEEMKAEG